jgi:hypothetical protein
VSRAARRIGRDGIGDRPPPRTTPTAPASPLDLVDVIRALTSRPAALGGIVAVAAAAVLHLGVGGASLSIRPTKRSAAAPTSVAVAATPDALPEDVPPPAPPPPRPPPPPPSSTSRLPTTAATAAAP